MVGVFAVVVAATFLRQTGVPKWNTVWAEDGKVFAQCSYDRSFGECLTASYQGYLHVVPRFGAAAVTAFDPRWLPAGMTLVAALVAGACGVLVARAVRDATRSAAAGLLAGISLALVWAAGREVSGNLANLHWVLLAASLVVLVSAWLGRRVAAGDLVLLGLTTVSSPFSLLLPVVALGGVLARAKRARLALGIVALGATVQLIVLVTSTRDPAPGRPVSLRSIIGELWRRVVSEAWFGHGLRNLIVPGLLIATVVALVTLVVRQRNGSAKVPCRRVLAATAATVALPVIGTAIFLLSVGLNHGVTTRFSDRYTYEVAVLTVCAIAIGTGVLATAAEGVADGSTGRPSSGSPWIRWPVRSAAVVAAGAMSVGFAISFLLVARASPGPNANLGIVAARSQCSAASAGQTVLISPITKLASTSWTVTIPCDRLLP